MAELSPTAMLDPIVKGWAEEAGMRTEQLSTIIGGNFIGGLVGVPLDMFLTQLGSKIASFFIGASGLLLGTYTMKRKGRMQVDTMQISSRILTEFLDPSPDDIKAIQRQIGDFIDGVVQGRWDKVAYAFVRNPREFQGMLPQGAKKKTGQEEIKPGSHYCDEHPDDPRCIEHKKAIHGETEQPTYPKGPGIIHKL